MAFNFPRYARNSVLQLSRSGNQAGNYLVASKALNHIKEVIKIIKRFVATTRGRGIDRVVKREAS